MAPDVMVLKSKLSQAVILTSSDAVKAVKQGKNDILAQNLTPYLKEL